MELAILLNRKLGGCYFASIGTFPDSTKARNMRLEQISFVRKIFPMLGKFALDAPQVYANSLVIAVFVAPVIVNSV